MPRSLRIEYAGAWYHVMNRGINRLDIFTKNEHREIFLSLLSDISFSFKIKIHSYCLMDNHYHLLIETPYPNLGRAMRYLNGVYTQRYNRLLGRDGPLFRGRYKAILIEAENYLLKVSRYIHLNPVTANIIRHPQDYAWSSYKYFYNTTPAPWLHVHHILSYFNSKKSYIDFVHEGVDKETFDFYSKYQNPPLLGEKLFVEEHIKKLSENYKMETSTDINKLRKVPDIDKISEAVSNYFNIELYMLKIPYKKNNYPRMLAIYLSRNVSMISHKNISTYFTGISRVSVSTILKRCEVLINSVKSFENDYKKLILILEGVCKVDT